MNVITLKRILVPTDFSETSAAAVKYGVALAHTFNAQLHLLHAEVRHDLEMMVERQRAVETLVAEMATPASVPGPDESAQHTARDLLGPSLTEEEQKSLHVEYVLRASGMGGAYVEIVRYAKEREIDLIVMGTHGRGFVAHMLMGSVAEKVVRKAPCPVLTVRHPEHEFVLPD
jgi:nucleotide-binding universal stress UspA family protein